MSDLLVLPSGKHRCCHWSPVEGQTSYACRVPAVHTIHRVRPPATANACAEHLEAVKRAVAGAR